MFERYTDVCTFWVNILYEFWIEAAIFFNSLVSRCMAASGTNILKAGQRDSGTNRPKAGLSRRQRDGWNVCERLIINMHSGVG